MQTYTKEIEAAIRPEAEDASTVVHFNYKQVVLESEDDRGNIIWAVDGKPQLWLTAKDGSAVCLKDVAVSVSDDNLNIIITIPHNEAARPPDVLNGQHG